MRQKLKLAPGAQWRVSRLLDSVFQTARIGVEINGDSSGCKAGPSTLPLIKLPNICYKTITTVCMDCVHTVFHSLGRILHI